MLVERPGAGQRLGLVALAEAQGGIPCHLSKTPPPCLAHHCFMFTFNSLAQARGGV